MFSLIEGVLERIKALGVILGADLLVF